MNSTPAHKVRDPQRAPGQILDPRRRFLRLYPHLVEVPFKSCASCALKDEHEDCEAAPCSTSDGYATGCAYALR